MNLYNFLSYIFIFPYERTVLNKYKEKAKKYGSGSRIHLKVEDKKIFYNVFNRCPNCVRKFLNAKDVIIVLSEQNTSYSYSYIKITFNEGK